MAQISKAVELKEKGNLLFANKKYDEAAAVYTDAIAHDDSSAVFFANRAACHFATQRHEQAVSDAQKAIELDPSYVKAWARLAASHDALTNYAESIEAYQHAAALLPNADPASSALRSTYASAQIAVANKIMNPETMALPVLAAMARAHDIPVPPPHTLANMPTIRRAVMHHPKFTTQPRLRLLVIPESPVEPLRQVELDRGPAVRRDICGLLHSARSASVVLHSEDQIAYAKGRPDGVGVGRMHTSYEAFMGDPALARRPSNTRARALLRRDDLHGPILVMKTAFIKTKDSGIFGWAEDILCWDRVSEAELRGEKFRKLREEWVRYMGM